MLENTHRILKGYISIPGKRSSFPELGEKWVVSTDIEEIQAVDLIMILTWI